MRWEKGVYWKQEPLPRYRASIECCGLCDGILYGVYELLSVIQLDSTEPNIDREREGERTDACKTVEDLSGSLSDTNLVRRE